MNVDDLVKAMKRHARRMDVFMNAGLSESKAYDLADAMFERDRMLFDDDRRICFECNHFDIQSGCKVGRNPSPFELQECPSFVLLRKE